MSFEVLIDDNFHYGDEGERYSHGIFATFAAAEAAARAIVESSVRGQFKRGMTAEQLIKAYHTFGDDPFIRPVPADSRFSAWDYAASYIPRFLTEAQAESSAPSA